MWSLELETLDQLLGDDMPLTVIRRLYPDGATFAKSIHSLLLNADVRLTSEDGSDVPGWRWRVLFVDGAVVRELSQLTLARQSKACVGSRRASAERPAHLPPQFGEIALRNKEPDHLAIGTRLDSIAGPAPQPACQSLINEMTRVAGPSGPTGREIPAQG